MGPTKLMGQSHYEHLPRRCRTLGKLHYQPAIELQPFSRLKKQAQNCSTDTQETLLSREDSEIPQHRVSQSISTQKESIKPPGLNTKTQTSTQPTLPCISEVCYEILCTAKQHPVTGSSVVGKYPASSQSDHPQELGNLHP